MIQLRKSSGTDGASQKPKKDKKEGEIEDADFEVVD